MDQCNQKAEQTLLNCKYKLKISKQVKINKVRLYYNLKLFPRKMITINLSKIKLRCILLKRDLQNITTIFKHGKQYLQG